MKTYRKWSSIAALVIAIPVGVLPLMAEEGHGSKTPDAAMLSQRVQELERRVQALEAIVRPEREKETQAEMVELIDDAYRKIAMQLVRISREYASAVSEDASPNELVRQKNELLRHCGLLEKIAEERERVSEGHILQETYLMCPMGCKTESVKSRCEVCGMPKV